MDIKLIEKVQKLLSLATSTNEHEARLAAEKANELMVLHNISIQQVGELSEEEYENREVFKGKVLPFEAHWAMMIVREHFFVEAVYRKARKTRYHATLAEVSLVGEKTNVQIAAYVFDFLKLKFKELWKQYQAESFAPHSSKGSYYNGLVVGLDQQLSRRRQMIEQDKAMVLVRDPKLDDMMKKFHGPVKDGGKTSYDKDYDAMAQGKLDGAKIQINKGIETKSESSGLSLAHKK